MKKTLILFLVIIILLTGCNAKESVAENVSNYQNNVVDYSKDIEELKRKIDELEEKNEELDNKILSYENNTTTLRNELEKIKTEYKNDLNKLKQELNKTNDTKTLNNIVNNLEKKVAQLESNADDIHIVKFNSGDTLMCYKHIDYTLSNTTEFCSFSYSLVVKNGETYGDRFAITKGVGWPVPKTTKTFMGWFTEKNGKGQKISPSTKVDLNSDIELYAYFQENN